ncbi:acetylxylan esterase [Fictibacillus phosphorivorans]|uniref:acetylxylan esterase n=1 Tax=Fictibacillus phosphorivorans TaxID=1221500 RepID=UPI0020405469|nr:alpha/beta fold hydrolase [Fictibacillus phosphorivorans]MCM3718541.1 alpha/beta fold hydrolase [Fictibacillus phosphorivorans]MCM3776103.1 alpha/beta fold hydrolase [Fictibacillus phosphorivorans]
MIDEPWKEYVPVSNREPNFESFWEETKRESNNQPLEIRRSDISYPIQNINAQKLIYKGFNGTDIAAFYLTPHSQKEKLPCLLMLHGYGGNKGSIANYAKYLMMGYAVVALDTRGHGESGNGSYPAGGTGSWVTQGILDPATYYYRHVYMDVIRALDVIETLSEVDQERVVIYGVSMGGGIALAVAGLDARPSFVVADVPNLCDLPLAIQQKMEGSLTAVEAFLRQYPDQFKQVFKTLSFFDNKHLAQNISCPVQISAGGKDLICPPQTIYGVFNLIKTKKNITYDPFSGHDLPGSVSHIDHLVEVLAEFKEERVTKR